MNRQQLRASSQLLAEKSYLSNLDRSRIIQANNPAITAQYGQRDGDRGIQALHSINGGVIAAQSLTNAALPVGADVPMAVSTRAGNAYLDARPTR